MKCENCGSDFTFWMALKQGTPFRFKCSKCKARYKVSTPRMKLIFCVLFMLSIGLSIGVGFGAANLGDVLLIPFFFFMIGSWLLFEILIYRYISTHGTFTRIGISEHSSKDNVSKDRT